MEGIQHAASLKNEIKMKWWGGKEKEKEFLFVERLELFYIIANTQINKHTFRRRKVRRVLEIDNKSELHIFKQ